MLGTDRPVSDSERPPVMTDSTMPPEGFNPDTAPRFGLNAPYTKDLSFDHPMAPRRFSTPGAPPISVHVGTQEIGRAAGRESGWQNVEISVSAGSLKNKKN